MSVFINKRLKLITGLFLGVVCGVILRAAFSKSSSPSAVVNQPEMPILIAQNTTKPAETTVQVVPAAAPVPGLPPITEYTGTNSTAPDGKEVIGPDGKEVLPPDGKETLGPVGEYIPSTRPAAVNPVNGAPTIEFLNNTPNSNNPLLTPPNPQNVGGPVVSPETR